MLEINPKHPIIRGLWQHVQSSTTTTAPAGGSSGLAGTITQQLFDNALITAGLVDDPRRMLDQLNRLMLAAVGVPPAAAAAAAAAAATTATAVAAADADAADVDAGTASASNSTANKPTGNAE